MQREILITRQDSRLRLDGWVSGVVKNFSRTGLKKFIHQGKILVNSQLVQPDYRLKSGDKVCFEIPSPPVPALLPRNLPLKIIFADKAIIVVNKPPGLVVHPTGGQASPATTERDTLVAGLLYRYGKLSTINGPLRPGIVHRLDKDTSGVMVAARTNPAHLSLARQFKQRTVNKVYLALVHGFIPQTQGEITLPIGHSFAQARQVINLRPGGREAITQFKVVKRFNNKYTLLKIRTKTGRTHQIRVHFDFISHPIVGDKIYRSSVIGHRSSVMERQALHAYKLGFIHPVKNTYVEFTAPLPQDMKNVLRMLGHKTSQNNL